MMWNVLARCIVALSDVLGWALSWAERMDNLSAVVGLDDGNSLKSKGVLEVARLWGINESWECRSFNWGAVPLFGGRGT